MAEGQVRIDEVYVFCLVDPADDTEGIPAFRAPGGMAMPLIGADWRRVEQLRDVAKQTAEQLGKQIELVRFTTRQHVEWIGNGPLKNPASFCPGCGNRLFGAMRARGGCAGCYPDLPPEPATSLGEPG